MNTLSTLKALPLLGILATSITLAPGVVYAENNHRMQQNDTRQSYNHRHAHNEQYRHNESKGHKHKQHRVAQSHDWRVNHHHRHDVHMPYVERYTIDYDNSYRLQHHLESGQVRFVFGMHSDNLDIYIRD